MTTWDDDWLQGHKARMAGIHKRPVPTNVVPIRPAGPLSGGRISKRGGSTNTPHLFDPSEDEIQIAAVNFLELALPPPLRFLHIPNGGSRNAAEAGKLKAMGVQAGAADILILGFSPFIWIELKSRKGVLRKEQKGWRDWCRSIGAPWFLCRSVEDVAEALESLQIRLIGKLT